MKILVATPLYPPDDGGPATYARTIEKALPKEGIEVVLCSFSNFRHYPKGISHLLYTWKLLRSTKGVDVIYSLDLVSAGLPALIASYFTGKKLVLKMVGDYAWEQGTQRFGVKENLDEFVLKRDYSIAVKFFRFIQKMVAQRAVRVIVPSVYLKGIVSSWGIPKEKITVIYNSFKPDLPTEGKEKLRLRFGLTAPTIISVGRFVPWKGFKVLMDAVAEVKKQIPDVVLEIAGSGDSKEYVEYAKEKGYDFVNFLGLVNHAELMKHIRAADCFALNTGYEGLSHVLLETMALETPVVTTNVGGNPELFAQWSKTPLVSYNNSTELTARIFSVLQDKESATDAAKSASAFVASFTEERMIREVAEEFHRIIHPT